MSAVLDSRGTACAAILATVLAHISRSGESPDDDRPELALRALRRGDSSGALTALWDCVAGWPVGVVDDTGNIGYCGRERSKLAPLCRALAEWIEGDDDAAYARDVAADSLAPYIGTRDAAHHAIGIGIALAESVRLRRALAPLRAFGAALARVFARPAEAAEYVCTMRLNTTDERMSLFGAYIAALPWGEQGDGSFVNHKSWWPARGGYTVWLNAPGKAGVVAEVEIYDDDVIYPASGAPYVADYSRATVVRTLRSRAEAWALRQEARAASRAAHAEYLDRLDAMAAMLADGAEGIVRSDGQLGGSLRLSDWPDGQRVSARGAERRARRGPCAYVDVAVQPSCIADDGARRWSF